MDKTCIFSASAPAAIGPYSQAVGVGGLVFLSGMLGVDPVTGVLVGDTAAEQARQACRNISALLSSEGMTPQNVVKTTVFIKDMSAFAEVNAAYAELFAADPPARSCVEVSRLPKDALVEIECIAAR